MKNFGSINILDWMKEEIDIMKETLKRLDDFDVFHIRLTDIDSFEKEVKEYAKKHPESHIEATAFIFSSKNPEKNRKWSFRKKE